MNTSNGLTITKGLPCSGKSTWAEAQREAHPDRVRIVCRDDIRASLGTRFEDGDEDLVARVRDYAIDQLLIAGYRVICSDTNLSPKVERRLTQIAKTRKVPHEVLSFMHVSLETCLSRNAERWASGNTKVPDSAIISMSNQFLTESR